MAGPKNEQKRPNGEVFGREIPDKGCRTGVGDTYGVGDGDLCRGFTGGQKIGKDTKSDK